jgi:acyl carrier protein
MKVNEFIEKLKETLELEDEELNEDTNLKDLEEYDSLSVLSIIAMIDENFGKQLSAQQFSDVTTVTSLIEKIGVENFE